jgi:hypothetical protein
MLSSQSSFQVISREPALYISTFFTEIATCRMPDGDIRRLLLKRGGMNLDPNWGHRGGVPYEASVYSHVLRPLALSVPRIHAIDACESETLLWMEYFDDALRIHLTEVPALNPPAAWIGRFHLLNETRLEELAGIVNRYDFLYYLGWSQRTQELAAPLKLTWLSEVCALYEDHVGELLDGTLTVIHGEYYPKNVLVRSSGEVVPVDWESAAIAAGEIDVASLMEGWDDVERRSCLTAYASARWSGCAPPAFARRIALARMYLMLRWLGDPSQWTDDHHPQKTLAELRRLGKQVRSLRW